MDVFVFTCVFVCLLLFVSFNCDSKYGNARTEFVKSLQILTCHVHSML